LKWLEEDAAQELGPGHKLRHNMAQPSRWVYSLWSMMPIHQPWFCQLAFWCLLCQQWLKDSGGSDTIPTTHLLTILNLSNPRGRIQMFFFLCWPYLNNHEIHGCGMVAVQDPTHQLMW
jgi:hypothetical protein